jgi:SulP family sulfate permease
VKEASQPVRTVIVDAEGITDLDITGTEMLGSLLDWLTDRGVKLLCARVRLDLRETMKAQGFEDRLGSDRFFLRVQDAVEAFHQDQGSG